MFEMFRSVSIETVIELAHSIRKARNLAMRGVRQQEVNDQFVALPKLEIDEPCLFKGEV